MRVISFSLWGNDPSYAEGTMANVLLAHEVYPGWVCRVYCGPDVAPEVVRELEGRGAQCPIVRDVRGPWHGLFWRFYAASDPAVSVMLSRDADSRLNWRERAAVDEWLASSEPFHVMRDHPWHAQEIPGGMWGVRDGFLHDMAGWVDRWRRYDAKGIDQRFLRVYVWPKVERHHLAHDEYFFFSDGRTRPFPAHRSIAPLSYVGQVAPPEAEPGPPARPASARASGTPAVSVVMPVRNAARFVRNAAASVLAQTFSDLELIVVDDGSEDATLEIVAGLGDPRVRVVSPGRVGLPAALNAGMAVARAPYFARMDADDLSAAERLERQIAHLERDPACVLIGTWARLIDVAGCEIGALEYPMEDAAIRRELHQRNQLVHGSVVMRAAALARAGGYDESLPTAEDYDLWFRMGELGRFANLPEALYSLRVHGRSKTAEEGIVVARTHVMVRQRAVARARRARKAGPAGAPAFPVPPPDRAGEAAARLSWAMAFHGLRSTPDALCYAWTAVMASPLDARAWRFLARVCLVAAGARRVKRAAARAPLVSALLVR
jgi:GT2 family glycosyltransferase